TSGCSRATSFTISSRRSSSTCGPPVCRSATTASRMPHNAGGQCGSRNRSRCRRVPPSPSPAARTSVRPTRWGSDITGTWYPIGCGTGPIGVLSRRLLAARLTEEQQLAHARTKSRQPTTAAAKTASRRATSQPAKDQVAVGGAATVVREDALEDLLEALIAAKKGDFSQRLSIRRKGVMREIAMSYNDLVEMN